MADPGNNQLLHYPTVDQLVINNNASNASLTAIGPLSAYVDPYSNLLICDGANRVLYYAPQLVTENAASYSQRALAAGMFAAVFPALPANIVSSGTAAAPAGVLPLPTTLSDTQVLVNGTPAPLFYVSPGQINVQLSNGLPSGGTATLQVVRPSTSQVYGSQEFSLASADPALFTLNASGGGQVAAYNFVDGTTNTSSNPVAQGQVIVMYGTGLGAVPNAPPDGQAPAGALSAASAPQILLGASATSFVPASDVLYSGLSPLFPGIWQIPGNKGESPEYKTSEEGTNDVAEAPSRICGADAATKHPPAPDRPADIRHRTQPGPVITIIWPRATGLDEVLVVPSTKL